MKGSLIRIVIADDHPIVVEGVRTWLAESSPIRIVGTARSFHELLEVLGATEADVVVLDLTGMQVGPLTMVRRLRRIYPDLAIVVFSSATDLVPELLAAGVLAYVVKEEMATQLFSAISAAHTGRQFLSPLVAASLTQRGQPVDLLDFSRREIQILTLLSDGLGTEAIAIQMDLDPRSVQNYITGLRRKTGCTQRTQLVDWYRRIRTKESDHTHESALTG